MYLWIATCMRAHLAHVAFEISDHSPNFLDTPRIYFQNHTVKTKSKVFKSDKYVMKFTKFE
jgi:hypothetical protein